MSPCLAVPALPSSTSSAERGKATWGCFYLVFEDRKVLVLDRKCGHVFSLGKKISNLEGNENFQTFHFGMEHQCQQVLGSGQGSTSSGCALLKVWVWPDKSLWLTFPPQAVSFHRSTLPARWAYWAVDLARDSHGTTSAEVRSGLFESCSGAYGYLLTYEELLTQAPFLQGL